MGNQRLDDALGITVYERVETFGEDGWLASVIVFEGLVPEPAGGFAGLTAWPTPGAVGPIRGALHPVRFYDYRHGKGTSYA
jgi:hypothetical protein